jgi:hypothetical protein
MRDYFCETTDDRGECPNYADYEIKVCMDDDEGPITEYVCKECIERSGLDIDDYAIRKMNENRGYDYTWREIEKEETV